MQLIGTIRVPRNLGQITERLPAAKYSTSERQTPKMGRQSSLPQLRLSEMSRAQAQQSMAVPSSASKGRGGSLATIKEREENVRSADPNMSKSRAMAAAVQA